MPSWMTSACIPADQHMSRVSISNSVTVTACSSKGGDNVCPASEAVQARGACRCRAVCLSSVDQYASGGCKGAAAWVSLGAVGRRCAGCRRAEHCRGAGSTSGEHAHLGHRCAGTAAAAAQTIKVSMAMLVITAPLLWLKQQYLSVCSSSNSPIAALQLACL
jgi:hypothetical protein